MSEESSPLVELGGKLRKLHPPSLSNLISFFDETEDYLFFVWMVKEFLPEQEQTILCMSGPCEQISAFASHFEDRYFPLDQMFADGDAEGYADLTNRIPMMVHGVSYEDLHEADRWRNGLQLMTYLVESPLVPEYEGGGRTSLSEICAEYMPREILQRVPADGFPYKQLCEAVHDTDYKALAHWVGVIFGDTGIFHLDVSLEEFYSGTGPEWNREEVEGYTQDWLDAERIQGEIYAFCDWLEQDEQAHFEEMLNFILNSRIYKDYLKKVKEEHEDQEK